MNELRNRVGQLAVIVPFEGAEEDIQAHDGKIVTPVSFGASGLGGNSWTTEPALFDAYGNVIGWDDLDLKPLDDPTSIQSEPLVMAE